MKDSEELVSLKRAAARARAKQQYRVSVSPYAILTLFRQRDEAVELARKWAPPPQPKEKPRIEL